jgi:hypothetical protein
MKTIHRTDSTRTGVRMAIKIAAVTAGLGAMSVALVAEAADARRDSEPEGRHQDAQHEDQTAPLEVQAPMGFSCISRGPAAPVEIGNEYAALVEEVPA